MLYLLDFPDGEQVEEEFHNVLEARKCAFNLLQRNTIDSRGFSVRLDRMTARGLESMGLVNLDGMWTREEPPGGKVFFDRLESGFVSWKPITRMSTVICDDERVMFDADLFTQDGVRAWCVCVLKATEPDGIPMVKVRMMPSFDEEGESCWVFGEGPKSCTFWKVEMEEVRRWSRC